MFVREADYAGDLLGQRFAARGVIRLVNHRDHFGDRPLATRESLSRAARRLWRCARAYQRLSFVHPH
ncbi:hypothetical protein ACLBP9_31230, partial [Klebsiella pneumoniae]|uniref:hypothetical protein n=1 Tax=Klebsiella pneumoniae TaxID=573 RepID=UPI0039684333